MKLQVNTYNVQLMKFFKCIILLLEKQNWFILLKKYGQLSTISKFFLLSNASTIDLSFHSNLIWVAGEDMSEEHRPFEWSWKSINGPQELFESIFYIHKHSDISSSVHKKLSFFFKINIFKLT